MQLPDTVLVRSDAPPRLGLRENLAQFTLLVLVNAFVGGMVGIERVVLPLLAEREFGLASKTAILSFIISFGIVKALANLFAGRLSDRIGRRGVLITGWLFGLPSVGSAGRERSVWWRRSDKYCQQTSRNVLCGVAQGT